MMTRAIPQTQVIEGSNKRLISLDLTLSNSESNKSPIVIFCHGYKGFKDWGCWNLVAEYFAQNGFHFLKFNFSHNGVTPNTPTDFSDLEAFGNNNYSKELADLEAVINWLETECSEKSRIQLDSIYTIGHSRGGGIVSLAAAKDSRIKKGVTWASVFDLTERLPKNTEEWRKNGVVHQLNGRTKQEMPLYFQFYENTAMNKKELSIAYQGRKIRSPFCIIHGAEDTAVILEEAIKLHEIIPSSELIIMEHTGHTFGSYHPWNSSQLPTELKEVVEETIRFLQD